MTLKPAWRGPIGPHMVSPEWQWAWRGLLAAIPVLSTGDPFVYGQGELGDLVSGAPVISTPYGLAVDCSAAGDMITAPISSIDTGSGSFALLFTGDGTPASSGKFVITSSADNQFQLYRAGNDNAFDFQIGGTDLTNWDGGFGDDIPLMWDGTTRLIVLTWDSAAEEAELFLEGTSRGTRSGTWTPPTVTGPLRIGDRADGARTIGGTIHCFYSWNRVLTPSEIWNLAADPFGPIRPRLWGPELAAVGSTVSLYAIADGTLTTLVDEADLTTNIYTSIDDDPATPTDTDWVNNSIGTASGFFDLTDMPAAFGTADSAEIVVRYRGQNFGSGTVTLYAQLYQSDESTSLSNEVAVANVTGDTSFANTAAVTITGINTSANKAVWDAARVRLRWATT